MTEKPPVANAERRIAWLFMWPLALAFSVGAWLAFNRGQWWITGLYVSLVVLMGWLTSRIVMPDVPHDATEESTSQKERDLAHIIGQAYLALIVGAALFALVAGARWWWAVLIAVVLYILAPLARSLLTHAVYR